MFSILVDQVVRNTKGTESSNLRQCPNFVTDIYHVKEFCTYIDILIYYFFIEENKNQEMSANGKKNDGENFIQNYRVVYVKIYIPKI